jgi:hypothetical protein
MPEGGYNWDTTKATEKGLRNIQKQAASYDLDRIVRAGKEDQDYKSGTSGAGRVIADMSKKNQDFINRNRRKDGSLNSAALDLLGNYWDDRSDYQRDLNQFIKSGPAAREAYLDRFPVGGRINLGIPAAFNAAMNVATPIKYFAQTAGDVAGKLIPKGIKEAFGFHKNKFMNDLSNVGPGLKKEFKKLARLNSTEESLLNTINTEMTSSQKSAQELLQAQNEDWIDAILGDDIKDAETTVMDNAEKELALAKKILFGVNDTSQTIAYDPTQDVDTRTSGPDEVEDWMGEIQPRISGALDQTDIFDTSADDQFYKDTWGVTRDQYNKIMTAPENLDVNEGLWSQAEGYDDKWLEDALGYPVYKSKSGRFFKVNPETNYVQMDDDITDEVTKLSMSMRTDTPVSMDEKRNVVAQAYGSDKALDETGTWGNDEINMHYDWIKYKQGQGQEFGDRKRVINPVNPGWQLPGTNELVDQINWNTANAPLDTNQLYPPELTEDFIQDNITTTDWGWNKGGYLKKFDDGGYANMSTYEKLKAINDSIAEG